MGVGKRTEQKLEVEKMASRAYKQDMPPEGGYAPVNFKRIPAKTLFRGKWLFVGIVGYHAAALCYYAKYQRPMLKKIRTEHNGFRLALQPLMLAERDRAFIKELKKHRDAEEELMSDTEGWEVGTWFGQKVYKTVPDNQLLHYYSAGKVSWEYFAHYEQSGIWNDLSEQGQKYA